MKNIFSNFNSIISFSHYNIRTENLKVILLLLFITFFSTSNIYGKNSSTLRGKIIGDNSNILKASTVCISNRIFKINVSVDDEGYYYCNNLKAGDYTIVYSSNGSRVVNDIIIKESLMHKLNISVLKTNSSLVNF